MHPLQPIPISTLFLLLLPLTTSLPAPNANDAIESSHAPTTTATIHKNLVSDIIGHLAGKHTPTASSSATSHPNLISGIIGHLDKPTPTPSSTTPSHHNLVGELLSHLGKHTSTPSLTATPTATNMISSLTCSSVTHPEASEVFEGCVPFSITGSQGSSTLVSSTFSPSVSPSSTTPAETMPPATTKPPLPTLPSVNPTYGGCIPGVECPPGPEAYTLGYGLGGGGIGSPGK